MVKRAASLVFAVLLFVPSAGAQVSDDPSFSSVSGFATKIGDRGVIVWSSDAPVFPRVEWGCSGSSMNRSINPAVLVPDTAGMIFIEGARACPTVHAELVDQISGVRSPHISFASTNAYTDSYGPGDPYDIDLVVQVDSPAQPQVPGAPSLRPDLTLAEVAEGVNVMAERLYDALDGHARLRNVVVTDTLVDYAANVPFYPTFGCAQRRANLADILFQTTIPFDSHTWGGFAIADPCTQISMGRAGQLVVRYTGDLHMGYVMTHELMHYAFNSPDLYSVAGSGGCSDRASGRDVSIMHNSGGWSGRWWLTELDRDIDRSTSGFSGCRGGTSSWKTLTSRYSAIANTNTIDHGDSTRARGNPDGGVLNIMVLSRSAPGFSTLTHVDANALDAGPPPAININDLRPV